MVSKKKKKLTSEVPEAMEVRLLAEVPYITVEAVALGFSALKAPWPLCTKLPTFVPSQGTGILDLMTSKTVCSSKYSNMQSESDAVTVHQRCACHTRRNLKTI